MILHGILPSREVLFLFIYALVAVLSLIGPGTSMGYSSIALPVLTSNSSVIVLKEDEVPLFASLPIISQIFGSLSSVITMKRGRRVAIATGSFVCTVGWIIVTFSYSVVPLFVGRILTGFSAGLCSSPAAVYISEVSTVRWRTVFTSCTSLFICTGILLVYFFGFLLRDDWQGVASICILFPGVSAISAILFLPESPIWLLTKGRSEEARKCLFRIRGLQQETTTFQKEFYDLITYVEVQRKGIDEISDRSERMCLILEFWRKLKGMLTVFRLPEVWKPFLILSGYFFFQQFSGLYVLIAYAVDVIVNSGITMDPFLITVILGVVQLIGGMVTIVCSARIGRRKFSITSGAGMSISLIVLGINMQFFDDYTVPILPLICVITFVVSGSIGFIVLPWAMIGELYPSEHVNVLGALTTCFGSIFNFAAVQLYPKMAQYDMVATIYFYCIITVIATLFVSLLLPETRGRTKLEIEERFRKK